MKFDDYLQYIKENTNLFKEINVVEYVKAQGDSLTGGAQYSLEDATNYETTKDMVLTVECKLSNLGKKILTFPSLVNTETDNTKELEKALVVVKHKLKEVTANYVAAVNEAFMESGFKFVSKSELKTLNITEKEPTEDSNTDDLDNLPDL